MSRERSALWTSSTVKYVKPNGCPTGIGPASGLGSAGPEAGKSVGGEELENREPEAIKCLLKQSSMDALSDTVVSL